MISSPIPAQAFMSLQLVHPKTTSDSFHQTYQGVVPANSEVPVSSLRSVCARALEAGIAESQF